MFHILKKTSKLAVFALLGLALTATVPAIPAHAAEPPLQWGACPPPPDGIPDAGMQCADVVVPLNYSKPSGRKITVKISRVQTSKPGIRRGVLLTNPGGPGGAGLDLPRLFSVIMPQEVLDHYDLIGFDPRGVDKSSAVSCGLTAQQAEQAYVPLLQQNSFAATVTFMSQVAHSCADTSGDTLKYITTANTARDMNAIRKALGEPKISYLGYSYGTYLGAVYSSLFPNQTDRFILDSSVNPNALWRDQFRMWGEGGDIRFPDFARFAAANNDTYGLGSTQAQVEHTYFQLVNQLTQNPVTIADGTVVNGPMFRELTFGGLYSEAGFPDLAALWQSLKESAPTNIVQQNLKQLSPGLEAGDDNLAAAGLSIVCGDTNWPESPLTYRLGLTLDTLAHPKFGELGSMIWPCAFWQTEPAEPLVHISSQGPTNILMLQSLRDPATPYPGAQQMHASLGQRSRLVSVDMGDHALYLLAGNTCADATASAYLADGTLPVADTTCAANPSAALKPMTSTQQKVLRELQDRLWQR